MEPIVNETRVKQEAWRNFKCFTIKIREDDLAALNQRLKMYGYDTMTERTKDFVVDKFPQVTEDSQTASILPCRE